MAFLVSWFVPPAGPPTSAQMGPGQMGPGMMGRQGQGQTSTMPMPQMADVIRQMAERLAARKPLDPDKAEQLRRLADQLRAVAGQMAEGMGGGMGGMMVGLIEKPLLRAVIRESKGNQVRAAQLLGINRNTLRKKLKEHGIDPDVV